MPDSATSRAPRSRRRRRTPRHRRARAVPPDRAARGRRCMVRPRARAARRPHAGAYLPLARASARAADGRAGRRAKLPSREATEKALGFDLDATVIWRGMPVRGRRRRASSARVARRRRFARTAPCDAARRRPSGALSATWPSGALRRARATGRRVSTDGAVRRGRARRGALAASGGLAATAAGRGGRVRRRGARQGGDAATATPSSAPATSRAGAIRSAVRAAAAEAQTRGRVKSIADAFREGYERTTTKREGAATGRRRRAWRDVSGR